MRSIHDDTQKKTLTTTLLLTNWKSQLTDGLNSCPAYQKEYLLLPSSMVN